MNGETIDKVTWQKLASDHAKAVRRWTEPFRARRRTGQSHPVHDFLFVYYQYSPTKLEQWHPGIETYLVDHQLGSFSPAHYRFLEDRELIYCDPLQIGQKELGRLRWIASLLRKTRQRRGNYSCLGLHEWAMVYQGDEVRHGKTTGLRLPQAEIDGLVESRPVTCSHFDAYRFFAAEARPLNRLAPTLESRMEMEQPACIHANMDLYKWAFKSMPWVGSDLLRRCFDLAMSARAVDMRASPYDLSKYEDFEPVKIETPEGRSQYEQLQRRIAEQAQPLREELASQLERVVQLAEEDAKA